MEAVKMHSVGFQPSRNYGGVFIDYLLLKFFLKGKYFNFRLLPRKFDANADSRSGMDFYCFIFDTNEDNYINTKLVSKKFIYNNYKRKYLVFLTKFKKFKEGIM